MKKIIVVFAMVAAMFSLRNGALLAQVATVQAKPLTDQDINLLRKDVASQKKQIVAANMQLTDAEAQKFWPVYDQYSADFMKIGDTRYALIKQYASSYAGMTDAQAKELLQKSFGVDESVIRLREKYMPLFEKVISAKQTARFFQIDRRLTAVLDLQLASEIPIVEP